MAKQVSEAALGIRQFLPILEAARSQKVNEADTRSIIHKFLSDVLGYDFISDITKEFAIRGTFADFAVKIDGEIKFIVEAKEIGSKLRDGHIRQAVGYAVNKGVPWCVLTDGAVWRLYRIEFTQPIETTQVFEIDLLGVPPSESGQLLALLSKQCMKKGEIDSFWVKRRTLNEGNLLRALFSRRGLVSIRRELRAITSVLVPIEEVATSIQSLLSESARDHLAAGGVKIPRRKQKRRPRAVTSSTDPSPTANQRQQSSEAKANPINNKLHD